MIVLAWSQRAAPQRCFAVPLGAMHAVGGLSQEPPAVTVMLVLHQMQHISCRSSYSGVVLHDAICAPIGSSVALRCLVSGCCVCVRFTMHAMRPVTAGCGCGPCCHGSWVGILEVRIRVCLMVPSSTGSSCLGCYHRGLQQSCPIASLARSCAAVAVRAGRLWTARQLCCCL